MKAYTHSITMGHILMIAKDIEELGKSYSFKFEILDGMSISVAHEILTGNSSGLVHKRIVASKLIEEYEEVRDLYKLINQIYTR